MYYGIHGLERVGCAHPTYIYICQLYIYIYSLYNLRAVRFGPPQTKYLATPMVMLRYETGISIPGVAVSLETYTPDIFLPKYLATFLQRRRFSVKVKNAKSDVKIQVNGIPQGSVVSVTFFAIKIN